MKRILYTFFGSVALVALLIPVIYAFSLTRPLSTNNNVVAGVLLMLVGYSDKKDKCEITLNIQRKNLSTEKLEKADVCPQPFKEGIPYLKFCISKALNFERKVLTSDYPAEEKIEKDFQKKYGTPLILEKNRMADRDNYWYKYNPKAINTLLKKAYVKPTDTILTIQSQKFYNIIFKKYISEKTAVIVSLLEKTAIFDNYALEYESKAMKDKKFNGIDYLKDLSKITGGDIETLGFVMRRHIDKTLPAILKMLSQVLKDYDPDLYKEVKDKLKAP